MYEDTFDLRDDGTVRLAWDDVEVTLKRPTLEEYRELLLLEVDARAELQSFIIEGEGIIRDLDAIGTTENPGPYPRLYAKTCWLLGGVDVNPLTLPTWLLSTAQFKELAAHWRMVPLARGGTTGLSQATLESMTTTDSP